MGGITGFFNISNASELVYETLSILGNQCNGRVGIAGKDWIEQGAKMSDLNIPYDTDILGYTLHSLVNSSLQPIVHPGIFVSNCEIYNWKELCTQFNINATNDADLFIQLLEKHIANSTNVHEIMKNIDLVLSLVEGVYAFAYLRDNNVYIARDILGLKSLWYSFFNGFAFASEKKALNYKQFPVIQELNPREIISYNINSDSFDIYKRQFFNMLPEHTENFDYIAAKTQHLLENAIKIRLPDEPFGLFFSGGLDSTVLACIFKKFGKIPGKDFFCYTAGFKEINSSPDVIHAQHAANNLKLDLIVHEISLKEVSEYLLTVVPLIEEANVPKIGVALTLYSACKAAQKDGIKIMFSGSGADEIFAGYNRHKYSNNINKECYRDLLNIYEKNTYRDDVTCNYHCINVRAPYLDNKLVEYSLKIPAKYKIKDNKNKLILRKIAENIGISSTFAHRKKQAAQYGSKFDGAIDKLARKNGYSTKTEYLKQFYAMPSMKLGVLFSSGKDSNYAIYIMQQQNHSIKCLITLKSINPDSYMFHTPNIELAQLQAQAMSLPLIEHITLGQKELELEDLKKAILQAKEIYGIDGIVTGALYSNYQRERIEKICDELKLKVFSPLWHIDQEKEMRQLINLGFEFIFSSVAAYGLNKKWLGHIINEKDVDSLVKLNKKVGINIAGEGGEFESFVIDGPIYKKRIEILSSEIEELDEYTAKLHIKNAILVEKELEYKKLLF